MANLGQKNGIYHIRFRFQGKEYKKSLKTGDADSAAAAKHSVELTIHRLLTGLILLPNEIDPGDFIVSGGTLQQPRKAVKKRSLPSTNQLIGEYLLSQKKFLASSSHSTLAMHLRHLTRHLGDSKRNWFKIGFHTYRHSFGSNLASRRVDQRVIDEFMGHTTEAMRKRYRHLFPKDRRSAIESFSLATKKT